MIKTNSTLVAAIFPALKSLAYIQNWISTPGSLLFSLTDNLAVSAILSSFAPLRFILFGKKAKEATEENNSIQFN